MKITMDIPNTLVDKIGEYSRENDKDFISCINELIEKGINEKHLKRTTRKKAADE